MFKVTAWIIGSRKPRRWRCRTEAEVNRIVRDIRANGFDELVGPADRPKNRTFWPAHQVRKIEVELAEK